MKLYVLLFIIHLTISNLEIRYGCLSDFDLDNTRIKSLYSRVFETSCQFLDACYRNCFDVLFKNDCDDQFLDHLNENCDNQTRFSKFICRRAAQKWFEYVQENSFDYWDSVRCRPVFLVTDENECLDENATDDSIICDDSAMFYPHRVIDNIFMFQNLENGQCLSAVEAGIDIEMLSCNENSPLQKWKIRGQDDANEFFGYSVESVAFPGFCINNADALVGCNSNAQAILIQFRDENGIFVELIP